MGQILVGVKIIIEATKTTFDSLWNVNCLYSENIDSQFDTITQISYRDYMQIVCQTAEIMPFTIIILRLLLNCCCLICIRIILGLLILRLSHFSTLHFEIFTILSCVRERGVAKNPGTFLFCSFVDRPPLYRFDWPTI